jgi:hypothetical protein
MRFTFPAQVNAKCKCNAIIINIGLTSSRVFDDMTTLCKMFCPDDLKREMDSIAKAGSASYNEPRTEARAEDAMEEGRYKEIGEEMEEEEEEEREEEQEEEEEEEGEE